MDHTNVNCPCFDKTQQCSAVRKGIELCHGQITHVLYKKVFVVELAWLPSKFAVMNKAG